MLLYEYLGRSAFLFILFFFQQHFRLRRWEKLYTQKRNSQTSFTFTHGVPIYRIAKKKEKKGRHLLG